MWEKEARRRRRGRGALLLAKDGHKEATAVVNMRLQADAFAQLGRHPLRLVITRRPHALRRVLAEKPRLECGASAQPTAVTAIAHTTVEEDTRVLELDDAAPLALPDAAAAIVAAAGAARDDEDLPSLVADGSGPRSGVVY